MAMQKDSERQTAVREPEPGMPAPLGGGPEQAGVAAGGARWVENLSEAAGERLLSAADAIRQRRLGTGVWGAAATAVADRLENTALYLQEDKLAGMAEEVSGIVRRYPVQTLIVGAAVGFMLGRIRK
jgi:hypothetical protein